jgi:hypothetical protein
MSRQLAADSPLFLNLKNIMKKILFFTGVSLFCSFLSYGQSGESVSSNKLPAKIKITKAGLKDKIMGGWAGQTIGVTFGGPYEFMYNGTYIQDYQPLKWYDGYLKETMLNNPGLYDDLYMDITFLEVFHRLGLDAPVDSFASAFAHAGYMLWHANQAARYNILNGIMPPESGYWENNPHADDIDFQIEADFSGLMSPGMPGAAAAVGDKIGHMMNYGDGWYGGVFVGAMYSMAFVSNDIRYIVEEALKVIPSKSTFYQCIADVIDWHDQYPDDWHQTWFNIQRKWSSETGCPDGVFNALNIDAKINSAYVVMGLLYGGGDYTRSLEITTRAGQDADCNPSTVGGILGAMLGYSHIPDFWKKGLKEAENIKFKYTNMAINDVYEAGFNQALEMIKRHGGVIDNDNIIIPVQQPEPVQYEKSFEGLYPVAKVNFYHADIDTISLQFEGTGLVLKGYVHKKVYAAPDYTFHIDFYLDNEKVESAKLSTNVNERRDQLFWKYKLPDKRHELKIIVRNPAPGYEAVTTDYVIYSDQEKKGEIISL